MTGRYLLDTSIVSAPVSKAPNAVVVDRLRKNEAECAIAALVWHELSFGCNRLPNGKRRAALEAYLRDVVKVSFPILPYDDAAATWHARERARLEALGRPAPFVDGQIAAIAHVHGLVVATTNAKDFSCFEGLTVEDWSKRESGPRQS